MKMIIYVPSMNLCLNHDFKSFYVTESLSGQTEYLYGEYGDGKRVLIKRRSKTLDGGKSLKVSLHDIYETASKPGLNTIEI